MIDYIEDTVIDLQAGALSSAPASLDAAPIIYMFPFITALVISMAIIPLMMRLAPRLGMLDLPDERKVHALPVPRVGGIGIVLGSILSIALWLELDTVVVSYLLGAVLLLLFGVWDDIQDIGHYKKFAGQILAVVCVVYLGDVYIKYLPFFGLDPISAEIGKPFTLFVIVGVINALNTSDGLDGLAGGESILSLACLAYLAYTSGGIVILIMTTATIGGILGFLRYNSHPAQVFMGDSGSQFLGYTLGFLAVLQTQVVNHALSPVIALLIIGLPLIDILYVVIQRTYNRLSWFKPTREHIHHRLLDFGFHHYESVVIIYSIQAMLVTVAVLMPYETDILLLGIYLSIIIVIFTGLHKAEAVGLRIHQNSKEAYLEGIVSTVKSHQWLQGRIYDVLFYSMSLYLVAGALLATEIPADFGWIGILLGLVMLFRITFGNQVRFLYMRPLVYITIAYIVYLVNTYQPDYLEGADPFTYIFFGVIVTCIIVLVRFTDRDKFQLSTMDFLMILVILALGFVANAGSIEARTTAIILKVVILFYGSELVLGHMKKQWNFFVASVLGSLLIISYRGLGTYF